MKHDYDSVRRLFQEAGYDARITYWALASMGLFRAEFEEALEFVEAAESLMIDSDKVLELAGPCPMPEGWRLAFFRGTTMLMLKSGKDAAFWLKQAENIQPTVEGANNLGVTMAREGRLAEARGLFVKSLGRFPGYSDALAN